jgi:tetratricopeptide (TPR) repeat protein
VLTHGESGAEFRRGSFERPSVDLFGIQTDLAQEVARFLREWLGEEIDLRGGRHQTESVAAWTLFQRGERSRKQGEASLLENDLGAFVTAFQTADSLLAEAEREDPAWARPPGLRAHLARRWAQLSAADPIEAAEWVEQGLAHVERTLARDARNAEAFETRGILRYLKWRLSLESDPTAAADLLRAAEDDLNASVRYDPTRANAWNVLSIIHSQKPSLVDAKLTALRAYEEDAYLRAADQVLWRLYSTSYDLEQFPDAVQYCAEGRRRFPDNPQFVECQLWLLASRAEEPDVDRAWALLSQLEESSPPQSWERDGARGRILVGGVLARAGLADSANSVFMSARRGPAIDPSQELLGLEAVFRIQMGDEEEAMELIKGYLTASPEHRAGWRWTSHWWWRQIQDNADFQQLVGSGGRSP